MKNKKGSTIVWAVTLIMLLMVIVGASLSLAYVHYNQSIKNHNKTQAELIANSAIKTLTSVIEKGENNDQLIPENINDTINVYKMELNQPFGKVSDITITRKKTNLLIASLKATYSEETYTVYAYMTQSKGAWSTKLYDTKGNRNIKVSDSSGDSGNTGGDSGGTGTGGSSNYLPTGNDAASTLDQRLTLMLNQYYGKEKNFTVFADWYKKQCDFMKKTPDANIAKWWFDNVDNGDDYEIRKQFLICMTTTGTFDKFDDTLYEKAKNSGLIFSNDNPGTVLWFPDLFVSFKVFPNSNGKYMIYASPSDNASHGAVYFIYNEGKWYATKGKPVSISEFSNEDSLKDAVKDDTKWQLIE